MLSRKTIRTPLSDTEFLYKVTMVSEDCRVNTPEYHYLQFEMLQQILNNRDLSIAGPDYFQKMQMSHNGERWVIELTTIGPKDASS
jgi:hypothetical protein